MSGECYYLGREEASIRVWRRGDDGEELEFGTEILGSLGEIKLLLEAVRKMEPRDVDDLEAMLVAAIFSSSSSSSASASIGKPSLVVGLPVR